MDISQAEVIMYNHLTFMEAANYLSELSKQGHVSFHSSQESRLHQVLGMYEENPHFIGSPKEKAKTLVPLLRMLMLHACHVDINFASNMVHPVIESKNVPSFEYVKNCGNDFEMPQGKDTIQKLLSLFQRLFLPHRVLKMLSDCEKEKTNQVNGGMLFLDHGEFLLLRFKMEEGEIEPEVEDGGSEVEMQSCWTLVVSISTGELHGRVDEVTQNLSDYFTDLDHNI